MTLGGVSLHCATLAHGFRRGAKTSINLDIILMKSRYALFAALFALFTVMQSQAQSLEEMAKDAKIEWMIGKWQAESDNGAVTLHFAWELVKKAVMLHVKTPDMESKGYTVKDPGGEDLLYFAIDNHGAITKGKWSAENDELVLRMESKTGDGTRKMAVVFSGSESKGLKVKLYGLNGAELDSTPRMELSFKKQK